jgi:hypothetical protein
VKRIWPLLSLLASLAACRENDEPGSAEELLADMKAADYTSWARAPGYPERTPSSAPHSDEVEIFVNDVVEAALADGVSGEWPVGSIIAKDGYTEDGELALTALMEKREDGWFWAEYDGEGTALYSGAPTICTDCHEPGADYVRAFGFP